MCPSDTEHDKVLDDAIQMLISSGRYRDAIERLEFACVGAGKRYGEWNPQALEYRIKLVYAMTQAGRLTDAENVVSTLLSGLNKRREEGTICAARARTRLADILFRSNRLDEAAILAESSHKRLRDLLSETHPDTLEAATIHGIIQDRQGNHKGAFKTLTALVELYDCGNRNDIDILPILWALSHNAVVKRNYDLAYQYGYRAVEESVRLYGPRHKATGKAWTVLAANANEQGNDEKALYFSDRALSVFRENDALHMPSAEIANEIAATMRVRLGRKR